MLPVPLYTLAVLAAAGSGWYEDPAGGSGCWRNSVTGESYDCTDGVDGDKTGDDGWDDKTGNDDGWDDKTGEMPSPSPLPNASSPLNPNLGPLKILCLHGGDGSGPGFQSEMSGFANAFPSSVTFVYANGGYGSDGGYLWVPDPPGGKDEPTTNRDVADASVDVLDAIVSAQGPFDGIMGYSQGSMMVLYYLSRVPAGTFRFALMFCGYVPTTHLGMVEYIDEAAPISIPAFIFAGSNDYIISNAQTEGQRDKFDADQRTYYVGTGVGHVVPGSSSTPGYSQAIAFISQFPSSTSPVPSPDPIPSPQAEAKGLHLTGESAQIFFGPRGECSLKYDNGRLVSNCEVIVR